MAVTAFMNVFGFHISEKSHHGGRELALDRYRIERDRSRRRKMRRWRREQQVRDIAWIVALK